MNHIRGYQHDYSSYAEHMYTKDVRERKAQTMVAVLNDFYQNHLSHLSLLDVGSSTGIIANYLAAYFKSVTGIDIDKHAVKYASAQKKAPHIDFVIGDGIHLNFADHAFDVVICAQVYEHVPDATYLMSEIYRTLKPGGVCYFAAGNRFNVYEPHYKLPLLSVLPRSLAHLYLRATGKGQHYYEKHLSFWGLKQLVSHFCVIDYTQKIVADPAAYQAGYMIPPHSLQHQFAKWFIRYAYAMFPGYIWLLKK